MTPSPELADYQTTIATPDGRMPVFGVHPASAPSDAWPLVVMFMDVNGVRAELKAFAARYARAGLHVVLPDLYHHFGEGIAFDARIPIHERPKAEIDQILALLDKLTDELVLSDTAALVEGLRAARLASSARAGCVGYCMGGRHVLRAMCERPDLFAAGAALFPTYAVTEALDAPYRRLDRAQGRLYIAVGGDDHLMPPDQIAQLRSAVEAIAGRAELAVHPGAGHAYAFPDRPTVYRPEAAEQDWTRAIALFTDALKE